MRTVDIPGGTATFRDREDVRIRHRRLIEAATVAALPALAKINTTDPDAAAKALTGPEATTLFELQDASIVGLLASWTLEGPTPTLETIGDLDPVVYDALAERTRETGAQVAAAEVFKETPEAESPTVPSDDSERVSVEPGGFEPTTSTTTPTLDGESTATDPSTRD